MSKRAMDKTSALARVVERQMRNWEIARTQGAKAPLPRAGVVEDYVTVSRTAGSRGGDVARLIGERFGWPVFDRQILSAMAGDDQIRRRLYQSMDERDLGWFEETLGSLNHDRYPLNDYFRTLCETVLSIARQGPAVFLGRAVDLILPRGTGLRVRIVAPREQCVRNFAEQHGVDAEEAGARIAELEEEKARFILNHFQVREDDLTRHDLIINLESCSIDVAAELVLVALRSKDATEPDASGSTGAGAAPEA